MLSDERIKKFANDIADYFEPEYGGYGFPPIMTQCPEEIIRTAITEAVDANQEAHQALVEHHKFHHQQQEIAEMQLAALKRELEEK